MRLYFAVILSHIEDWIRLCLMVPFLRRLNILEEQLTLIANTYKSTYTFMLVALNKVRLNKIKLKKQLNKVRVFLVLKKWVLFHHYYKMKEFILIVTWLWYSIPILSVLTRIANNIPCWNRLWLTSLLMSVRRALNQCMQYLLSTYKVLCKQHSLHMPRW